MDGGWTTASGIISQGIGNLSKKKIAGMPKHVSKTQAK
jgi:hypothetical protein